MRTIIQIVLVIVIGVLGYLCVESILKPIKFNKEVDKRYSLAIEKLTDIRRAQKHYKSDKGDFAKDFNTLIEWVRTDSFKVVKAIGSVPDSLTEDQALKMGIIKRDTVLFSVKDSLFPKKPNFEQMKYVPFTEKDTFLMATGEVETGSKVKVKVVEVKVPNRLLLNGLDEQLVVNLNDMRNKMTGYSGLKFGSLSQATNEAGNWE